MSLEIAPAVGIHDEVEPPPVPAAAGAAAETMPFSKRIADGLQEVNRQLLGTQRDLQQLAVGDVANLHEVLIRLEESRTALQLVLQVRNRALEAYQDVMRMQV